MIRKNGKPLNASIMKKYIFIIAILALGLVACSKNEDLNPDETSGKVSVYKISIPASIGPITKAVDFSGTDSGTGKPTAISSFKTTDKIYVYRKSPTATWLSYNSETDSFDFLSPSKNGKTCNLTGTITGSFAVGDVLLLLYNMNELYSDPLDCAFQYQDQDGTQDGVADFAIATVKVKSIEGDVITFCQEDDETDEAAHFVNIQSMFRFQFKDKSDDSPICVKHLIIFDDYAFVGWYYVFDDYNGSINFPITLASPTTDPIYLAIRINESMSDGAEMRFKVISDDGKVYTGLKAGPTGENKFVNGKYYYSSSPIPLAYETTLIAPSIIWTNPSSAVEPNCYCSYFITDDNFDITLSGLCRGYCFESWNGGTVRLNGFDSDDLIRGLNGNLTIELQNNSNNTISVNTQRAISCGGYLWLTGNGTLTVTTNYPNDCGISGRLNYYYTPIDFNNGPGVTSEQDFSDKLALDPSKTTVIRSARIDGPDNNSDGNPDYYTWTYTVTTTE